MSFDKEAKQELMDNERLKQRLVCAMLDGWCFGPVVVRHPPSRSSILVWAPRDKGFRGHKAVADVGADWINSALDEAGVPQYESIVRS